MNSAPNYRHWLLTLSLAAAAPGFAASAGSPATDAPATASGVAPATTAAPSAATFQDVHELEALARSEASRDFPPLTERQRFVIGPIEPRLELERCRQPVRAALTSAHHMPDRATVELRCQNAKPWHLYVQVRIVGTSSVAVAAHAIVAGSVLTAKDMRVEQHDISELPLGFLDDPAIAVGLTAAQAVQRGQSVTLVADGGGMSVRMAGKALSDGLINQRVKVQNLSSGKIVEGIARSEQVVEIISQ